MRLKIRTQIICSIAVMLILLAVVASVAIDRTDKIGRLAGDLNGRLVDKTRIAADIVDLGQQLRFVDTFIEKASDPEQDELARRIIQDRIKAVESQIASYRHYADSNLERSLLQNLERSRLAYLTEQQKLLATPVDDRRTAAADFDETLASTFDQANRQARGLSHLAEAEARTAREQVRSIMGDAQSTVLIVAGLALAIGLLILGVLLVSVFRPLARITTALIGLSRGQLDVPLTFSGRWGEIDAMAQALEIFRKNALALSSAHEETKAAHRLADSLARQDTLTGLANRRVLTSTIEEAIARSRRRGLACAVLVLDLDRFKPINDIYGRGAGDKVLCEVAERLIATVRSGETAGRLGGDEFAVVFEYQPGSDAPHRLAKRIIGNVSSPIVLEGRAVSIGASIGIATWPSDGDDADGLLHAADLAMLKAKRDERGSFRFFEPNMDLQLRARADLEARISHAILSGDIRPHYQPLVDLKADVIVGFEVLARWHDGDVVRPPSEFIQIAEDSGVMPELTYSVLRQACRDAKTWPGALTLALNVTPAQIADPRLPGVLSTLLDEEQFPACRLELEITENALIGDITSAKAVMTTLRNQGVRLSLDDFGTGYSSLQHLQVLKFDKLKIDRSFIQSMLNNTESRKIVEMVLALSRSLGIYTVAEGIEDGEHLRSLMEQGCEFGQGYYLGRPLPAVKISSLLAEAA